MYRLGAGGNIAGRTLKGSPQSLLDVWKRAVVEQLQCVRKNDMMEKEFKKCCPGPHIPFMYVCMYIFMYTCM